MKSTTAPRVGRSGWIVALGVSLLALVSLALIPVFLERQEGRLQREIEVLARARPMLPEVALVHSREMMRIEQYVNSGDSSFITSYENDLRREEELLNDLRQVIRGMPASYRSDLIQLEARSSDWKVLHSPLMEAGVLRTTPREFRESMEDDRNRYEALQSAVRDFEDRLIRDAGSAAFRLERQRSLQFWITVGAIGLAVASRQAVPSLLAGVWVGWIIAIGHPFGGTVAAIQSLIDVFGDPGQTRVIIFTLLMGALLLLLCRRVESKAAPRSSPTRGC